jgi:TM2 domain-containing membrane protein YozV
VAVGNGTKFCQNCGNQLPENAAFCINCGVAVSGATNGNNTAKPAADPNAKSKIVAGLLGIFLGYIGVHNFYLGYTKRGVAQVLLTVLSCGVLSGVSAIWGLIEGILYITGHEKYKTDAYGIELGE